MAAFDTLQKASFAARPFPVSDITVTGGLRDHVHEYPHSPGGAPEKLGRKLYEVRFKAPFTQGLKGYPGLWPDGLAYLRILFEGGQTFDLVIPTIGTMKAYCTNWVETATMRSNRAGVEADLTFREDQSDAFLNESLMSASVDDLKSALPVYRVALTDAQALPDEIIVALPRPDLDLTTHIPPFDLTILLQILDAAEQLFILIADVILIAEVFSAADALVSLCARADVVVRTLNHPRNHILMRAFHDLWAAARAVAADSLANQVPIQFYDVPSTMSVSAISTAIYGDTTHAMELLQTNPIQNAFAVKAGTRIKAYRFDLAAAKAA